MIWSERFEVRLDSWAATQQRVVRRLASTLSVELSTERLARVAAMPEASLEAHDVWLRAQLLIMRFTPENWNGAAQMLAQAIERAPTFSPLYSSLVQMNNTFHIAHPGMFRAAHKEERTLGLAQQAVRLDPRDSRAELSLGWALAMNKRYSQAETHMEIACELNPYDAWTLIAAGMFHSFIGNRSRAEDLSAQAMELTLSPSFAQWIYLATTRYLCGDDEGLLVASGHAHALTPEPYPWRTAALNNLFAWRAAAMWNLGRKEEAREEATALSRAYARELVRPVATGRCDDRPVAAAHLSDFGSRGVAAAACGRYRCRHPRWRHDASRLVIRCRLRRKVPSCSRRCDWHAGP